MVGLGFQARTVYLEKTAVSYELVGKKEAIQQQFIGEVAL